ncbi:hypothetical protein Tco_0060597 [Tanacetum coccineum]
MDTGTCSASGNDGILNDATPRVDAAMKAVSPSVVEETETNHYLRRKQMLQLVMLPGRSSYTRVMIELRADVELKDNIVVAMPKITREGHYTCNVRVEYEWKPPRCSSCKIFRHIHEECLKTTGAGEKKTVKKPNNDVEFGTNEGTTNLVNNRATLSGSSFMNIDNNGEFASNTLIGEKIDKIERQICEGKLRLLDNDRNPLVPTGIVESDSEVEVRDYYPDNDNYDSYDDDMYENHDLSEHLQSICDDPDITLEEPTEDQPLPADASLIALSPGYIADFDPEEDPAEYPADGGDNDVNESSDDDDDDDDVEKDEDDEEEEEHLSLADPSAVLIDDLVPSS